MITIKNAVDVALEAMTQAYEKHRSAGVDIMFTQAAGMVKAALEAMEPWQAVRNDDLDRWHVQHRDGRFMCRHKSKTPTRYASHMTAQRFADQLNARVRG